MRADDDIENVNTLNRETAEIERLVARKETDARELIRTMTRRVAEREARVAAPPCEAARTAELDAAAALTAAEVARLEGAHSELRALEHRVGALAAEREAAAAEAERRAARAQLEAPRAAHALALYSSISNIKWDYDDALAARGRLGGVVSVAASRSVKRFEIDDADADGGGGRAPFDVARDLWGLIDPAAL